MSEDTSHEFVKAEDDIVAPGPASFLEKDEDDFVDEPLSSPRLSVGADKINEQQFEDPELVVAPLSPSKAKAADFAHPKVPDATDAVEKSPSAVASEIAKVPTIEETDSQSKSGEASANALPAASEPEVKIETTGLAPRDAAASTQHHDLSPHPEDTPAPLFSSSSTPQPATEQPPAAKTAEEPSEPQKFDVTGDESGVTQEGSVNEQSVAEPQKEECGLNGACGRRLSENAICRASCGASDTGKTPPFEWDHFSI